MNENTRPRADGDGRSNGSAHSTAMDGKRSNEIQQDAPVKNLHISQPNGHTSPSSISAAQAKAYSHKYKHAFAIHREAHVSCLTRDSPQTVSFNGFKGLAHLVLATSILRLMIENFKKYGIRVTISASGPSRSDTIYGTILYLTVPCHLFVAYGIEVIAARYAREAVGRVKKSECEERDRQLDVERRALRDLCLPEISHLNLLNITERVLKLSTISLICWLAGFYALFQSLLNALAELMTFDDRDFYGDWWNCSDVRSYWTSWNKPVAHFMKRHIYAPLVGRGVPAPAAQILTFLFSAALHELLVGVPTHSILGLAFMGMVVQIPLIFLTDLFSRRGKKAGGEWGWRETVGNWVFWASFCLVGQPIAALGYYFAWQAKYGRPGEIERPDLGELFGGGQKS
ncbi:hypothetical protein B0A48_01861 [Cryoendolithus antarcticus]|uniref:diacylglycerol O-acyltransferase n=1 Tax=Cryoendolithus antarcticus TaxID=1507870 RepID=A0A1V8TQY1_9PEZI|nr:hypothetical protein B0A48_01861 [Cryoendolithus antarcticus]